MPEKMQEITKLDFFCKKDTVYNKEGHLPSGGDAQDRLVCKYHAKAFDQPSDTVAAHER